MNQPLLSIIIPTYNRPRLLPRAVNSALNQSLTDFEVIVVDDCSTMAVELPQHPQLQIIRLPKNRGGAAARNIGTTTARGRWITFLDDDDELLPDMAAISLAAIKNTNLPQPVGILTGIEVINQKGRVIERRFPPTLPCGCYFSLEEIPPDKSFLSKQTLVVEREVLLSIGGFDETFASRIHTELFLRLNQACSLLGVPQITYRLYKHSGYRVSSDPTRRQASFNRLVAKHRAIFQAHPKMFAEAIYNQAMVCFRLGQNRAAVKNLAWALKIDPIHTLGKINSLFKRCWRSQLRSFGT